MISVYSPIEKDFNNNGIKILHPSKAKVRKEDNGDYRIELTDTLDDLQYYQEGMIIRTDTPWGKQAFRLSNPTINNKKLTVKGKHVYFDSSRYVIVDSYVVDKSCNDALDHLNNACDVKTPFSMLSDITTINSYRCIRHTLEEAISVVIDRWGGHLVRDNFNIEVRSSIGQDKGVVLSYAKNISSIKATEDWDDVVTKILPVGKDGLTLPEKWMEIEEKLYDIPYTKVVSFDQGDISEEDYETEELYNEALIKDLRVQAEEYLKAYKEPKVNYSLSANIDNVSDIGDTIYVNHPKCNIDITTNVIAIEYDCILGEITKLEFGNFKNNLSDLISNVKSEVDETIGLELKSNNAKLQNELNEATNKINNAMSNSYVVYDGNQILVVDTLPKENAKNVIRINNGGIGFSQNGINGTFNSAWTIDGILDMQKINVINLVADMIKGGTLKLGSNLNESGIMELYDESNKLISRFDKSGLTFYCDNNSYIKINSEVGFAGYDANDNKTYWVDDDEFHQKKSVVEEEITIANKIRILPVKTDTNNGIGFISVV